MNNGFDSELTIYCTRCGAEMKSSARYCMKCGCLNYDHPANAKFKKFEESEDNKYEVGSKKKIVKEQEGTLVVGNNMGGKDLCFWVNMFAFLLVMIITIIFAVVQYSDNLLLIVYSHYPTIWLVICLYFLLFYGIELMFMKANKPWFAAFIPIYDMLVIAEMAMGSMVWAILYLVPFGGLIINYNLGQKFGNYGIFTLLLGVLFYPVLGYTSSILYGGYNFVDSYDENSTEKDYGKKSIMRKIIIFVFIASVCMFIASNFTSWRRGILTVQNENFAKQAQQLVNITKEKIKQGDYFCETSSTKITVDGTYYFIYNDTTEVGIGNHDTSGYVKIVNHSGTLTPYVYLNNTELAINETIDGNIIGEHVISATEASDHHSGGVTCNLT